MRVSVADLKRNYENLNVSFDVWKGESDAEPYIPPMLERLEAMGILRESEGARVIDVAQEGDKKELPPCILVKSDGATLYATTDLATLVQRVQDYHPDKILYLTDKRQALHFEQMFRAAKKSGIVPETTELQHIGFGTMNGKDGKPFKTRSGGVMRLETLIADITSYVEHKILENQTLSPAEASQIAKIIAVGALKYGDLSNLATKDYIFDLEDNELAAMHVFAKSVALAIQKVFPCKKVGEAVIGLEVPHAHIHLIPIQKESDMIFSNSKLKLTNEEFVEVATAINQAWEGGDK